MSLMNPEAGRDCLLEVVDILTFLVIPHFLMQGTALGAWRDSGFCPTEKDIDLGVLQENLQPKVWILLKKLASQGFDVEAFTMPFTRPKTVVAFKRYGTHVVKVDIVGMIKWRDLRFTATPIRQYVEEEYALVHSAKALENYRLSEELWGRRFLLPANIEAYLFNEYGPRWREPREDSMSRTRIYNFVEREGIPNGWLEQWD